MDKKELKKTPEFYFILLLFIVFFFVFGIFSILYSSSIYEYPKYERYSFSIIALAEKGVVNFTSFRMNYRFDEEKGSFSFTPEKDIARIIIHFPKDFEITSVEYWEDQAKKSFPFKYENLTKNKASILFENKTKKEWIFINFKTKLSPNSRFSFFKNSIWKNNDHFYFNMGTEFECTKENCFFNLLNAEIERTYLGTQQEGSSSINFINQSEGISSSKRHEFELSARSRNALTQKNIWMALGVSVIVGAIFGLFSILIAIFQEKNKFK